MAGSTEDNVDWYDLGKAKRLFQSPINVLILLFRVHHQIFVPKDLCFLIYTMWAQLKEIFICLTIETLWRKQGILWPEIQFINFGVRVVPSRPPAKMDTSAVLIFADFFDNFIYVNVVVTVISISTAVVFLFIFFVHRRAFQDDAGTG